MKKIIFVTILLLSIISFSKNSLAIALINSKDWRDVYLGLLYSNYENEKPYIITNLGEADLASRMAKNQDRIIVIESQKQPIVKNYEKFLELRGVDPKKIKVMSSSTPYLFQLEIAKKINPSCHIVVPSEFSYDAISAMPYALLNNCTVIFWNEDYRNTLLSFINKQNNIIFFGTFNERPWRLLNKNFTIINENNFFDNNKRMVEMVINWYKQHNKKFWVVYTNAKYIEEGYLLEKMPIMIFSGNIKNDVEFLKKNNVWLVEVIGPDMVNYGQQIRDLSNKTIGVVAKVARTFTGIPELRGKVYAIKVLSVDTPNPNLEITGVYFDNENQLVSIVFKNTGNTKVLFYTPSVRIVDNGVEIFSLSDDKVYAIYPNSYFTLTLKTPNKLTKIPELTAEVYTIYNYQKPLNNYIKHGNDNPPAIYNVTVSSLKDLSSIKVVSLDYNTKTEMIELKIKNDGNETVYVLPQLLGFLYSNDNTTLTARNYTEIKAGETVKIEIPGYLTQEEENKNKVVNLVVFYGSRYPVLTNSIQLKAEMKIFTPSAFEVITGKVSEFIKANTITVMIAGAMLCIILIVVVYYYKAKNE